MYILPGSDIASFEGRVNMRHPSQKDVVHMLLSCHRKYWQHKSITELVTVTIYVFTSDVSQGYRLSIP